MTTDKLRRAVLATVTYYDVLDYPLTAFELWRHMIGSGTTVWTLGEVMACMDDAQVRQYVEEKKGMYFLQGRQKLVVIRSTRERLSVEKIKKLRFYTKFLICVPWVKMVTLTGRLSYKNGEVSSDLDLLLAFEKGHIWMGRLLMTLWTHVLGIRRYGDHHADRVCLNYHITDETLEVPTKDLYGAHEYSFIVPLFGKEYFQEFVEKNRWIQTYKPHYMTQNIESGWHVTLHPVARLTRFIVGALLSPQFFEHQARAFQYKKIMANPKTQLSGAMILAKDEHLVFLPKPHGPRVFEEYKKRLSALELPWSILEI